MTIKEYAEKTQCMVFWTPNGVPHVRHIVDGKLLPITYDAVSSAPESSPEK